MVHVALLCQWVSPKTFVIHVLPTSDTLCPTIGLRKSSHVTADSALRQDDIVLKLKANK